MTVGNGKISEATSWLAKALVGILVWLALETRAEIKEIADTVQANDMRLTKIESLIQARSEARELSEAEQNRRLGLLEEWHRITDPRRR